MPARIEDYALIGDLETAALVSRDGAIDWLCMPHFDSGACFAALLGTRDHGRWRIAPRAAPQRVTRRYRDGTLVLETEFATADGCVRLVDFMGVWPGRTDLVRIVQGVSGTVELEMDLLVRFDYGSHVPWVRRIDGARVAVAGPHTLELHPSADVLDPDLAPQSRFTVSAGQRVSFVLTHSPSHEAGPVPMNPEAALARTDAWWSEWTARGRYRGRWREAVERSLITLKALTFEPTGGILAAPTTSLPEQPGGVRNWDYRMCWLRDATFTLYALLLAGYREEADAWREWLLRAAAGSPHDLQPLYGIRGERNMPEWVASWLPGYEGAAPVRIGNHAAVQFQLDVYGEVMDSLHVARGAGLAADVDAWKFQTVLMDFLESNWSRPDSGIWEVRGPERHFTHSKVMAWVAADRAVKAIECHAQPGDAARWRALAAKIHAEVCREAFDAERNTFVWYYGGREPDASLLLMAIVGFLPARDPRLLGTLAAIERELLVDGFVQRYRTRPDVEGLPPGEGVFLPCTFWYADNLALAGRHDEAVAVFERLLALRNDVGLLSEEYDVAGRRMLGNFPQALSHLALVNTARGLSFPGGPSEHRSGARGERPPEP